MSPSLHFAIRSDRGLIRGNNEDSAYAGPRLLALADGMGGHAAGEVASQLMIAALAQLDADQPGADLLDALALACDWGNQTIADRVAAEPEKLGMGCTLTAMLFDDTRIGLCHVGDSRAYLLRDEELHQITRDDTYVQSLVDAGELDPEEASSHPKRSMILKALTGEPVEPTLTMRHARVGDRYLICSDGLSDPVSRDTIALTLSEGSPAEAADRLISLALRSGGPDNVTVIVCDIIAGTSPTPDAQLAGAVGSHGDTALPDTAAGRAAAMRSQATTPLPTGATAAPADATAGTAPARPRRNPWRMIGTLAAVLIVIAGLSVVGLWRLSSYYYLDVEQVPAHQAAALSAGSASLAAAQSSSAAAATSEPTPAEEADPSASPEATDAEATSTPAEATPTTVSIADVPTERIVIRQGLPEHLGSLTFSRPYQQICMQPDNTLTTTSLDTDDCIPLTPGALNSAGISQIRTGLPAGSLDAIGEQVHALQTQYLLPQCTLERTTNCRGVAAHG